MEFGQVFPLAPGALKTGWLTVLFGGMLVLWVALFFFLSFMIKGAVQAEIALRDGRLVAKGGVYGREIPLDKVATAEARRIDLGRGEAKKACAGAPTAWACPGWPPAGTSWSMAKRPWCSSRTSPGPSTCPPASAMP